MSQPTIDDTTAVMREFDSSVTVSTPRGPMVLDSLLIGAVPYYLIEIVEGDDGEPELVLRCDGTSTVKDEDWIKTLEMLAGVLRYASDQIPDGMRKVNLAVTTLLDDDVETDTGAERGETSDGGRDEESTEPD